MSAHVELPSGEQFQIASDEQRATIVEVGGGLRDYRLGGTPLLDGYGPDEVCSGARGQSLLPWPNRIRDGAYSFEGSPQQLALTEPEKHNAIHGLARWCNWSLVEREPHRVALRYLLHPVPGYPFVLELRLDYSLSKEGLLVRTAAVNRGDRRCPYAAGAHPYLTVGTPTIDDATLRVPARTWLPTDERGIPTGRSGVEGTPYDFRKAQPLKGKVLDYTFSDLDRDSQGRAWVEMRSIDGSRFVSLWVDRKYSYLELFTGDTLKIPAHRRRGMGVEPMTCPPNGFQTGEGLVTLEPGELFESTWGIRPGASG